MATLDLGNVKGSDGAPGAGVASGGVAGNILMKNSSTSYDTKWGTASEVRTAAGVPQKPIVLSGSLTGSGSTVSTTLSNANITDSMYPVVQYTSDTSKFNGNLSLTVNTGSVVASAKVNGTVTFKIIMIEKA